MSAVAQTAFRRVALHINAPIRGKTLRKPSDAAAANMVTS